MEPIWNFSTRAAAKSLSKTLRLPSRPAAVPKVGVRALNSKHDHRNIVKSAVPDIPQPQGNLINTVFENVHRWGSKTAVECSVTGRQYTYDQVLDGISKWAGFLPKLGINRGDVIAVDMVNCPEYPIILLGSVSVGVIVTPINFNYTSEEIARQLKDSGAQLLLGDPSLERAILGGLSLYKKPLHLIMNGPSGIQGALNLQEILKDPTSLYTDTVKLTGHELAILPYSSGTTGLPKGVSISHSALAVNIHMNIHSTFSASKETTDDFQDSFMCLLPFYHIYGVLLIMIGLRCGVKLITIPEFEPKSYINNIRKNKVETLHLVPPLLDFLLHSPDATPESLASLRRLYIGSAPVSSSVAEAFKDKLKKDIFFQEAYGLTEVLVTNIVPVTGERVGTCGKLLPNISAKVIDTITGEGLPSNKTGEICLKSPAVMNGYFQNEAANAATIDEEGFLHSGDVGYFDDEGYLTIVDRIKELIKVKALQVSPSELEDVIRQHPEVVDVGVVGVPHDRQGEAPRAYIVTKNQVTENDIHRFIESRVAPHKKLIGGVAFVKELPKSAAGKFLRRDLKKLALG